MSKDTFYLHYYDIYLPLYKQLNRMIMNSEHKNETSLTNLIRTILDSPGEKDLYNVAANIHNHQLFFENLENIVYSDYDKMSKSSKKKIEDNFTSFDNLKQEFYCHTEGMYGSGWVWLIDRRGVLEVVSTHDNYSTEATSDNVTTILCLDLWEHAYWKDYNISRHKYLENFWKCVNWSVVDKRLQKAEKNLETASRIIH